jgi:hypothetical protein
MERLKIVNREESRASPDISPGTISSPLERHRAVVKDITEKALEIVNRISIQEMGKEKSHFELLEEYSLLYHYLDFLKRFVSSDR